MKKLSKSFICVSLVFLIVFLFKLEISVFAQERYQEIQNFSKVLNLIQQFYVEPVDTKKLIYGAIKGMLRELDPHTNFMPPEIYRDFERETGGEFGGIGIEISVQAGVLTIISPIEDTPAFKAGIQAGDKVIAINGKSTKNISLVEASQMMRGKLGEKIVLRIVRESVSEPMDISIVRGNVRVKSAKYTNLGDGYAYVKITSFIENTVIDLNKILADHKKANSKFSGLLLDLRKNPGGLLDQAVQMSDLFLKEGIIVSTIGRDSKQKEVSMATKKGQYTDFPIVILVDEYSASASEIVSGALQDNKRALVVGEKTFGKGSVQSVVKLGDGSALKLTVAKYYTPKGTSIQADGIHPDIVLDKISLDEIAKGKEPRVVREKDITGHLKGDLEDDETNSSATDKHKEEGFAWWKELSSKADKNLSTKEKLFKSDYQAFQAFNYLKSWGAFKKMQY